MDNTKENKLKGKTVHDILEPNKITMAIKVEIEKKRHEATMRQQAEEWAKAQHKQ